MRKLLAMLTFSLALAMGTTSAQASPPDPVRKDLVMLVPSQLECTNFTATTTAYSAKLDLGQVVLGPVAPLAMVAAVPTPMVATDSARAGLVSPNRWCGHVGALYPSRSKRVRQPLENETPAAGLPAPIDPGRQSQR